MLGLEGVPEREVAEVAVGSLRVCQSPLDRQMLSQATKQLQ